MTIARDILPPGTEIEFCGEKAVVVCDYGANALQVRLEDGWVTRWLWNFEGICCSVVSLPQACPA